MLMLIIFLLSSVAFIVGILIFLLTINEVLKFIHGEQREE